MGSAENTNLDRALNPGTVGKRRERITPKPSEAVALQASTVDVFGTLSPHVDSSP